MHKIVVVDDEQKICEVIKNTLELGGEYEVEFETDSRKGLELIQREKPDLVILDVVMPDLSGIEMLETIKKHVETCHIPVIIFTAYQKEQDFYRAAAIASYADMFVLKPFKGNDLLSHVEMLLSKAAGQQ